MCFLLIADACIKEELDDAEFDVEIRPVVNPLLIEVDVINEALIANNGNQIMGSNDSIEEIIIKGEPLQDDLVSKCSNKVVNYFCLVIDKDSVFLYTLLSLEIKVTLR